LSFNKNRKYLVASVGVLLEPDFISSGCPWLGAFGVGYEAVIDALKKENKTFAVYDGC
jgi:hypothetical protein